MRQLRGHLQRQVGHSAVLGTFYRLAAMQLTVNQADPLQQQGQQGLTGALTNHPALLVGPYAREGTLGQPQASNVSLPL